MQAAIKKVMINKDFDNDAEVKHINLASVSAACPVMNLKRNNYNELYLKANTTSKHCLQNKDRIKMYLRENPHL